MAATAKRLRRERKARETFRAYRKFVREIKLVSGVWNPMADGFLRATYGIKMPADSQSWD